MNDKSWIKKILWILLPAAVLLLSFMASCYSPFTDADMTRLRDNSVPEISVTAPPNESSYAATVIVEGMVSDHAQGTDPAASGMKERIPSLWYEVNPPVFGKQDILLSETGTFSFSFETSLFRGPITVTIFAIDWMGNGGRKTLNLLNEGSIPSFKAAAKNGKVDLQWESVPLSDSYSLSYSEGESIPGESYGVQIPVVSSPFTVTGLENGRKYNFLLKSKSSRGPDNYSSIVSAIPLSPLTLTPAVRNDYNRNIIEWNAIPATKLFKVFRSESRQGAYTLIASGYEGTIFKDEHFDFGKEYFYYVTPLSQDTPACMPGSIIPADIPDEADRFHMRLSNAGDLFAAIEAKGDHFFIMYLRTAPDDTTSTGILVYDAANPARPLKVTDFGVEDCYPLFFRVAGDFAYYITYISNRTSMLHVVNVSNPSSPQACGSCSVPAGSDYFEAGGNGVVYVSGNDGNLYAVDISASGMPHYSGISLKAAEIQRMQIYGNTLYAVEGGGNQLAIYSLTDPHLPQRMSAPAGLNNLYAIRIADDILYSYALSNALSIYSLRDPLTPVKISELFLPPIRDTDLTTRSESVQKFGDYLYIYYVSNGLCKVKISDPTQPQMAGHYTYFYGSTDYTVFNGFFYTLTMHGLEIRDFKAPRIKPVNSPKLLPGANSVLVSDGYLYASTFSSGLSVYDAADLANPVQRAHYADINATELKKAGDFILAVNTGGTFSKLLNAENPGNLKQVEVIYDEFSRFCDFRGDFLYAGSLIGPSFYRFTPENGMMFLKNFPKFNPSNAAVLSGNYAYYLNFSFSQNFGLTVYDLKDPVNPGLTGQNDFNNTPQADNSRHLLSVPSPAVVKDSYILFPGYTSPTGGSPSMDSLLIFSTDPKNPGYVSYAAVPSKIIDMVLRGDYLYAVTDSGGMLIESVHDPKRPFQVDYDPDIAAGPIHSIKLVNKQAVLACGDDGIKVVEIE